MSDLEGWAKIIEKEGRLIEERERKEAEARQARVDALWTDVRKTGDHKISLDADLGRVEARAWSAPNGRWVWRAGGETGVSDDEQEAKQAAIDATIARLERMIRTLRGEG